VQAGERSELVEGRLSGDVARVEHDVGTLDRLDERWRQSCGNVPGEMCIGDGNNLHTVKLATFVPVWSHRSDALRSMGRDD
jgi:hypothetical protein